MGKPHDDYKQLALLPEQHVEPCPVCGGDVELWQYSKSERDATSKVVMCANGDPIGPQDGLTNEGCLLYMPPEGHYRATAREALKYWNEFAKALTAQQRRRRWNRAKVLRAKDSA